jgi:hypothetical protein
MIALSRELAGCVFLFQVLQAVAVGLMIALLLWFENRTHVLRFQGTGDMA